MKIYARSNGKKTEADRLQLATRLVKAGYTVKIEKVMIDGKSTQVVEAERKVEKVREYIKTARCVRIVQIKSREDMMDYDLRELEINALDEACKILGRTRIRETAKEPPTREDANKDGCVLTRLVGPLSKQTIWAISQWEAVASDPKYCVEWTQLPR